MAISTGTTTPPKKSTPSYHGAKNGKTALPQTSKKAPHDSASNGSGKSSKG